MPEMQAYIAWANDNRILNSSSSGGIFQTLARHYLKANAITSEESGCTVYGAYQDNYRFAVKHRGVEKPADVELLIGSKYYQSEMIDVYPEVQRNLKNDQKVLFSGTPCQIAGLKRYLKESGVESTSHLLTVEVLCHGVSSRKVVLRYRDWLEEQSGKKVKDIHFRTKRRRWYDKGSSMEIFYDDGTIGVIDRHIDPFYLAYNHSLSLRPSCYSCPFANVSRIADITIGDFWGAENYIKDRKKLHEGIGLVMVNSTAGRDFWNSVQEEISSMPIDIESAIPRNGAIVCPAKRPENRQVFFSGLDVLSFDKIIVRCLGHKKILKIGIKGLIGDGRIQKLKRVIHHKSFH